MAKMKNWTTKRKSILAGITILLIAISGVTIFALNKADEPVITFKENIVFEYGQPTFIPSTIKDFPLKEINIMDNIIQDESIYDELSYIDDFDIIYDSTESTELIYDIDTLTVGEHSGKVYAKLGDIVKEFDFEYEVVDTNKPILSGVKEITIEKGKTPNYNNIKANDIVDGDLEIFMDDSNLDINTVGIYEVTVSTKDKNGNEVKESFKVNVVELANNEKIDDEGKVIQTDTSSSNEIPSTNNEDGYSNSNAGGSNSTPPKNNDNNNGNTNTPSQPQYACPNGKDKDRPCTDWVDYVNGYLTYSNHSSMSACQSAGDSILNQWWEIDGKEVINYACQEIGFNDPTYGSFYGLELMGGKVESGNLVGELYWLNSNKQWVQ